MPQRTLSMRRFATISLFLAVSSLLSLLFIASTPPENTYRTLRQDSFQAGEKYHYKIKLSFIPVGEADVSVHPSIFTLNNRPCYRVNVLGRTTGISDYFKVRNTYRSFVDTAAILPHRFVFSAREREYKKDQVLDFDHKRHQVVSTEKEEEKTFQVPTNVHDLISGYYYLRTLDYKKLANGQIISSPVFFDGELYNMRVKYAGKGEVKTRFGRIKVIKLTPILPPNKLFDGENGIRVWVSDDKNRVPVKLEVDFKIGGASMELDNYSGNKHAFNWI